MTLVVESDAGPAQALFDRSIAALNSLPALSQTIVVRVLRVEKAVVVLGSAQARPDRLTAFELVHRRSGGGAVLLDDEAMVWLDVIVGAGSSLFVDDVGLSMHWVGEACQRALGALGFATRLDDSLHVHRGAMVSHPLSRTVCWLGTGAGEVVDADGRKIVGVAQRRTRNGALLQIGAQVLPRQHLLSDVFDLQDRREEIRATERAIGAAPDGPTVGRVRSTCLEEITATIERLAEPATSHTSRTS